MTHYNDLFIDEPEPCIEEVIYAYLCCREGKRNNNAVIQFESNFTENIMELYYSIVNRTWKPKSHLCFVVQTPKAREVWAAQFSDRIIHHVIFNRINERFESQWIDTTFACIKNRGTGGACDWADRSFRRITRNYSRRAYGLKLDIHNFFPSIDRDILFTKLSLKVNEDWLLYLIESVINVDLKKDVHFPGNTKLLHLIEPHKSLLNSKPHLGLPIGNLTSQFSANEYLNDLDQRIVRSGLARHYGRYVDDLLIMSTSFNNLTIAHQLVIDSLTRLNIKLHPFKHKYHELNHGFDFCGMFFKTFRKYLRNKTKEIAKSKICDLSESEESSATLTSFMSVARRVNSFRLRTNWSNIIIDKFNSLFFDERLTKCYHVFKSL